MHGKKQTVSGKELIIKRKINTPRRFRTDKVEAENKDSDDGNLANRAFNFFALLLYF